MKRRIIRAAKQEDVIVDKKERIKILLEMLEEDNVSDRAILQYFLSSIRDDRIIEILEDCLADYEVD